MAVSPLESLTKLLLILETDGGYRLPHHQTWIAQARTLVACEMPVTIVVCNMPLCPSRLELGGDLTAEAARVQAERMCWWTDGRKHVCASCYLRGGV